MIAAYLRVSTDGQVEGFGLPDQRATVDAWAEREGVTIGAYHTDAGISGAKLDRPALTEVLRGAQAGTVTQVVVAKLDRLARDLMAQLWIEKELLKYGCEIVSVAEPFRGQDPANVLFRQVIGAFAEFERSRINERMTGGRMQKAARGGYAGGNAPTGYRSRKDSGALSVDEDAARLVKRLFVLRRRHPDWSLRQFAAALETEGFHGPKGGAIAAMSVKRILDREEFYRGRYRYGGVSSKGEHAPIIG